MGGGELMRGAIWSAKGNWNIKLSARHHQHVRRVVHDLIEGDQRKTKRHEFDDRPQTGHGRADSQSGKTVFADWRIDDSLRSESLEQSLADFVCALIFGDFLAHQENIRIARELFGERFVQRLTVGNLSHDFPPLK